MKLVVGISFDQYINIMPALLHWTCIRADSVMVFYKIEYIT